MIRYIFGFCLACLTVLQSCKTSAVLQTDQSSKKINSTPKNLAERFTDFQQDHQLFAGLIIVDAETNQVLFSKNEDKFFTPASNTKLFTLLAAQIYLSDSIPALQYAVSGDSLVIKGTGDPTFLTKNDVDSLAFNFLFQTNKTIYLIESQLTTGRFGAGWSWDDYPYYYQKENSAFPIAGQATRIACHPDSLDISIYPAFMSRFIKTDSTAHRFLTRQEYSNEITINPLRRPNFAREFEVPFYQDSSFTRLALGQLLEKEIGTVNPIVDFPFVTLYHLNSDSLYKELMLISDNFVAEQLLFLIGSHLDIELNTKNIINRILNQKAFATIPDRPRWVDGSGLSRYNLATPRSMIWLLDQLEDYLSDEQIKQWFPSGEHGGSLPEGLDKLDINAKTGTLSNNFCLSGYLNTASGKRLLFSWMNNHFMASKNTLVTDMEKLLRFVQETF